MGIDRRWNGAAFPIARRRRVAVRRVRRGTGSAQTFVMSLMGVTTSGVAGGVTTDHAATELPVVDAPPPADATPEQAPAAAIPAPSCRRWITPVPPSRCSAHATSAGSSAPSLEVVVGADLTEKLDRQSSRWIPGAAAGHHDDSLDSIYG
jgi:hypothetical protein